ncbi:MAG: hypothetical protein KH703_08315 [Campylobacter gracilis]|uniref:hypothetical protein n=1 Tax=Campylobacter gracilis TaxID=824 RepID=UPI0026E95EA6|nr:hypothetical protein [Campylobacter gracilis]MBS6153377.1 hypothetical protein [Campylobacter gracilis]
MEKSTAIFSSITALILLFIVLTLLVPKSKSENSKEFIPEKKVAIKEKVSFNGGDIERLLKLAFSGITAISLLMIAIILFGVCVHYVEYPYSSDKKVRFYLDTDVPATISIDKIDYIRKIDDNYIRGGIDADVTIKN